MIASLLVVDPRSIEMLYKGLLMLIIGGAVAAALILVPGRRPRRQRVPCGLSAGGYLFATLALLALVVFLAFGCLEGIGSCAPG